MESLELAQSNRGLRVARLGITVGLAVLFLALLLWGLREALPAHADPGILYVDGATGQDIGTCGAVDVPCQTISYTLNSRAGSGDTIRVAQGVYTENLTVDKQVTFEGGYVLSGTLWLTGTGETIIDGSNSRTVVGDWDGRFIYAPVVITDGGVYKMWYTGSDLFGTERIGYAESADGVNWTRPVTKPVLDTGDPGDWDERGVGQPSVITQDGLYEMWFFASNNDGVKQIGYATSTNGIDWTKYAGNPVLTVGDEGDWDETEAGGPRVLFDGGTYRVWYHGYSGECCDSIGYATSTDGISWTKYSGNPVFGPGDPGDWDDTFVFFTGIVSSSGQLHMWYSVGGGTGGIGHVTSTNGITWTRFLTGPVLSSGGPGAWDEDFVFAPALIHDGGMYRMWYVGTAPWQSAFGYATSTDGTTWTKSPSNPVLTRGTFGQWGQPVVAFVAGSDSSVLDGFTVRNGEAENGGGIYVEDASPTISGCAIAENTAYYAGGGGYVRGDAHPLILASQILSNTAVGWTGGGLAVVGGASLTLTTSVVASNTAPNGAGLAIGDGATPLIADNDIVSNTATWAGGGVRVIASGGTIQNNRILSNTAQGWAGGGMEVAVDAWTTVISNSIVGNTADTGGGIAVNWYCSVTIAGNEIVSNTAFDWTVGGILVNDYSSATVTRNKIANSTETGIMVNNGSTVTLTNNLIWSNNGDGVSTSDSTTWLINNTIDENDSEGVFVNLSDVTLENNIVANNGNCGINTWSGGLPSTATLSHNDFWDNAPEDYCDWSPGTGDISADPLFVDAANGDYHLQAGSPCIDAGTATGAPLIDFEGDSRPLDGNLDGTLAVDIGADEFRPYGVYLPLILRNS